MLKNLTRQRLVSEFITSINRLIYKFGHKEIVLDFSEVGQVYAYPTVPIVGLIDFYKERDIVFHFKGLNQYLKHISFQKPIRSTKSNISGYFNKLDRVWWFSNTEEICNLVDSIVLCLRRSIICEPGILDAFAWGLNEVMDNVIQHSEVGKGYLMAQINNRNINVCIYDYGIGIYNSLKNSEYSPGTTRDAISLCIQEGVTRDKSVGQGNGLWGLYNIVSLNDGHLTIISGNEGLYFKKKGKEVNSITDVILLDRTNQATNIEFHVNLGHEISISDALGSGDYVDLYIENLENEKGETVYKISEIGTGTGTRQSAALMQRELINIYKSTNRPIIIDFNTVAVISSSFADELIGKLISEIGFYQFQTIFKLVNMNKTIQSILEKSLAQRIGKSK